MSHTARAAWPQTARFFLLSLSLSLIVAAGCVPVASPPIEGQEEAMRIVWREIYGMTEEPPPIIWVDGDRLSCAEGRGFYSANYFGGPAGPTCVKGLYWTQPTFGLEMAHPDGFTFGGSTAAFPHELWHAALEIRGVEDIGHADPGFAWPDGIVARAYKELQARGL